MPAGCEPLTLKCHCAQACLTELLVDCPRFVDTPDPHDEALSKAPGLIPPRKRSRRVTRFLAANSASENEVCRFMAGQIASSERNGPFFRETPGITRLQNIDRALPQHIDEYFAAFFNLMGL